MHMMHVQKNNICTSTQVGVHVRNKSKGAIYTNLKRINDNKNDHTSLQTPCDTTEACSSLVLSHKENIIVENNPNGFKKIVPRIYANLDSC